MQSLDPLSGERCLTAIASCLLSLSTTCTFCVLMIELSLDDANILRFTDYIRHYVDETQFILITHRKGTMEASDRIYGVTMQERGVSKILAMELE